MATIKFENINKIYPNNVQAVFDFNLDVKDKEFIVFVGPSGCGKSTTLRMLAGLEDISMGKLYIDNILVNEVVPMDRNIAMVFQNYALYPHMSVAKNMGFALKYRKKKEILKDENGEPILEIDKIKIKELEKELKKLNKSNESNKEAKIDVLKAEINKYKTTPTQAYKMVHYSKKEIDSKINEAAEILGLTEYLKRKPKELSGGQRQRVALGRAIVRNPKVFLMDEPLSNLDAKLRVAMRSEITRIHKKVGATTIYVTHDQTEAMTMADRIVCMKDGYIQQIGTPEELYNYPANTFVGGFIGSPAMNFFNGYFDGKNFIFDNSDNKAQKVILVLNKELISLLEKYKNREIILGIRPENIYQETNNKYPNLSDPILIQCDVVELLGNEYVIYGLISNQNIVIKRDAETKILAGNKYVFMLNLDKILFFDKETTKRIE